MVCILCFKKTYFKNLPKILQWFCVREIKASCHNRHTSGIAYLFYPRELLSSLRWPLCAPGGWHLCMELPGLPQGCILIGLGQSGYPLKDKRRGRSGYCFFQLFLFLWQWWHPFVTRVHAGWLLLITQALRAPMTPNPLLTPSVLGVGTASWLLSFFPTLSAPLKGFPSLVSLRLNRMGQFVSGHNSYWYLPNVSCLIQ